MNPTAIVVAIDGPSGVGKSTVAAAVARRLQLPFLETGAMYRALGWQIYRLGIDPENRSEVEREAAALALELAVGPDDRVDIRVDGADLDERVRLPEVSEITSRISSYPAVRRKMVGLQRQFAERHGAVMEGRDIGSRVFPETPHKFFMTAPLRVRVERRLRQLEHAGETDLTVENLEKEVAQRDARDTQREESPLQVDATYTVVDTTHLAAEEAASLIAETVRSSSRSPANDC